MGRLNRGAGGRESDHGQNGNGGVCEWNWSAE
jgi:hypothetical protein